MDWALLSSFTLAMVAISNPLGKLPPWIHAIGKSEDRVQTGTALMLVGTAAIILVGFLWGGQPILQFFQIDLSSFRMAGGTILIVIGFDLLRGRTETEQENSDSQEKEIKKKVKRRFHHLVVPMAIPLIAGPGSIVTVTIYGFQPAEWRCFPAYSRIYIRKHRPLLPSFCIGIHKAIITWRRCSAAIRL